MKNHVILKIIISIVCLAGVLAIVYYGDEMPMYNQAENIPAQTISIDGFSFDPEELEYDGHGDLDFLEGVSLPGYSKQELKDLVFIEISTDDALSNKLVEYTARTEDGRYRSMRKLHLTGYTGPKITMPEHIPDVTPDTIEQFGQLLKAEEDFAVNDGFGNDASDHIDVEAERVMNDSSMIHYTVSIENIFGDRDLVKQDVVLSGKYAVIALSDEEVTIGVRQGFNPEEYIVRAERADGTPAMDEVILRGLVDTGNPGTYLLTYELDGQTAQLCVIVE